MLRLLQISSCGISTFGDGGDGGSFELAKADKEISMHWVTSFSDSPSHPAQFLAKSHSASHGYRLRYRLQLLRPGHARQQRGHSNGCTAEWGAPSSGWGAQYGGISSRSQCNSFLDKLKLGCHWRFD